MADALGSFQFSLLQLFPVYWVYQAIVDAARLVAVRYLFGSRVNTLFVNRFFGVEHLITTYLGLFVARKDLVGIGEFVRASMARCLRVQL